MRKPSIILQYRYTWLCLVCTEPLFIHRSLTIANYCFQEFNHSIIRPCQTSILSRHGTLTEKIDRFAGVLKLPHCMRNIAVVNVTPPEYFFEAATLFTIICSLKYYLHTCIKATGKVEQMRCENWYSNSYKNNHRSEGIRYANARTKVIIFCKSRPSNCI